MSRKLDDWLSAYLDYTENSEAPAAYHTWTGISVIAGALERKVYLQWGFNRIYPNEYIVLIGPSGQSRKGDAMGIGRKMIETLSLVKMIGEDNSQESIIRQMRGPLKTSKRTFTDENGQEQVHCSVSCFCEELAVFTGQQNTQMLAYLTNWYDSRDKWTRMTKHQGEDELHGVCFNLLAATAPDWLPHILTDEAIGGGFTSRVVFVVEEDKGKIIANPNAIEIDPTLWDNLAYDLELINSIVGPYTYDAEAQEAYEEWYEKEEQKIVQGKSDVNSPHLVGYRARRATQVHKLGMILSASRGQEQIICIADFDRAVALLKNVERKMPRVYTGLGKAKYVQETELIISYIKRHGEVRRSKLLADLYRDIDNFTLEAITKVLNDARIITIEVLRDHKDVSYRYIAKG